MLNVIKGEVEEYYGQFLDSDAGKLFVQGEPPSTGFSQMREMRP